MSASTRSVASLRTTAGPSRRGLPPSRPPQLRPIRPRAPASLSRAHRRTRLGFELFLSACDEFLELFVDARVDAGVRILGEQFLPALVRDSVSRARAESIPPVVVVGRRDPRPVEAGAVVAQRVLGAEEVPARPHLAQ